MCIMSSPKIPDVPPPSPPPAAEKKPEHALYRDRNKQQNSGQVTMLSGAGGVATNTLNLGRNSLLGE